MEVLQNNELIDVHGGAVNLGLIVAVLSVITAIIGLVDGIFRPMSCRK